MKPKILVGCPTSNYHEYALTQYSQALKSLTYPNIDILLVDNSKDNVYFNKLQALNLPVIKGPWFPSARDRIIASRNILRDKVLKEDYDYFLSLEQDVIPPKDFLERLLEHKKQIITGIYFTHIEKNNEIRTLPVIWTRLDKNSRYVLQPEDLNKGLIKIAGSGLGCLLIHSSVLKKIKFRYDKNFPAFDDVYFFLDCKEHNFPLYADTNLICKHLIKNRPWDWREIKN